jgi:hypothetical protein
VFFPPNVIPHSCKNGSGKSLRKRVLLAWAEVVLFVKWQDFLEPTLLELFGYALGPTLPGKGVEWHPECSFWHARHPSSLWPAQAKGQKLNCLKVLDITPSDFSCFQPCHCNMLIAWMSGNFWARNNFMPGLFEMLRSTYLMTSLQSCIIEL